MKTQGFEHQLQALRRMNGREHFALFMEMGTGKTWTLAADAERLYSSGKIDAVCVIAPNGVHQNWVRRELPTHLEVPHIARAWRSGAGKRERTILDQLLKPRDLGEQPPMRIFAINIDAVNTNDGFDFTKRFLQLTKCMLVIDESSRIKNPSARRTKRVMQLKDLAVVRRIASGLPITKAPVDVFSQMEFLEEGLLGTTSYRAFVAEYADLLDSSDHMFRQLAKRNPKAAQAQIVRRNDDGQPIWRNLDKLQRLIEPHSFRVLKRECLDLPEKIYTQRFFHLPTPQRKVYDEMEKEFRFTLDNGEILPVAAIAKLTKLQQITSGFILIPGQDEPLYIDENNPRLEALLDAAEDIDGKFIVWARFREEISSIVKAFTEQGRKVVQYHGGVNRTDRETAVDSFQDGDAEIFVGQPQSGGIGLTLTAATTVVYMSNWYDLETRKQSEDRAHRIGTTKPVVYIDITAVDSIDEPIARSLQTKSDMASAILGDRNLRIGNSILQHYEYER
jgi:SNF2 family DNA or RNA helicase